MQDLYHQPCVLPGSEIFALFEHSLWGQGLGAGKGGLSGLGFRV